jgi:adenosylhomocysteine nucleosidase
MTAKIAIVAALEREVKPLITAWRVVDRSHAGRHFRFFESEHAVLICGGIGEEAARRAAEAVFALYAPDTILSAGFAGASDPSLKVGTLFTPSRVVNARDSSVSETGTGSGTLVSFASIATADQKGRLASAYGAQAVDMEAAAVARAAQSRGVRFECVKAISDDQSFDLPGLNRFVQDGQFRTKRFIAYSLARPWLWLRLLRLAQNSRKAAETLCNFLERYNPQPEFLENVPSGLHLTSKRKIR